MESSIESWRFRTRSLCGLAPPTPYTIYLNVNHSRVPKEITIILQIKYILLIFVTVTTTRRKSLPFATSVDWESLGKFDGEDVLQ